MKSTIVLLHSPLLGPSSWRGTAEALKKRGRKVVVPSLVDVFKGQGPYYPKCARAVADAVGNDAESVVLVAHSAAGSLAPAVMGELKAPVRALIFVDASMPHPGKSWFETQPSEVSETLEGMAQNGRMPPWNKWMHDDVFKQVVPDANVRATVTSDIIAAPVSFLHEKAPPNDPVRGVPVGYLLLSQAYRPTLEDAQWMKWATAEHMTSHLGMISDPTGVAIAIEKLAEQAAGGAV